MRKRWYAACAAIALAAGLAPVRGQDAPAAEATDEAPATAAQPVGGIPELPASVFARASARDPFNPPGWQPPEEKPVAPAPDPAQAEPEIDLRLTGIIRSGLDRLVIINGRILAKDERVVLRRGRRSLRVRIVEVGEDEVLVSVGGQEKRLRLEHGNLGGVQ